MKNRLFLFLMMLLLIGCSGDKTDHSLALIVIDVEDNSLCYLLHDVIIAKNDSELIDFILKHNYSTISFKSEVKLIPSEEETLINSIRKSGVCIKSFVVPVSEPPGEIDLLKVKD